MMNNHAAHSLSGTPVDPHIGKRVRFFRTRGSLRQVVLATQVGMSPVALSRLECGLQSVSAERLAAIALALAVTPNDLLGVSDDSHI